MSSSPTYLHSGHLDASSLDLDSLLTDDDLTALLDSAQLLPDDGVVDVDEVEELDHIVRSVADKHGGDADDYIAYLDSLSPTSLPLKVAVVDEGDKFDWASSAALAVGAPSASTATTAASSQASSPSVTLRRSPQAEDKVEPHSPEPLLLIPSIPSSTPSSISPGISPSLTSSTSLHRLSSSLSSRLLGLCSSIIDSVFASSYTQQLVESVTALRQLLSSRSSTPFTLALSTPILPAFVSILQHPTSPPQLLLEVAWALTNLASGSSAHVDRLLEAGVVDALMLHLKAGGHTQVQDQTVWALGNIAGDSWQSRDLLLEKGLMQRVCSLAEEAEAGSGELLKQLCWTIHNLCRHKPCPIASRIAGCIPTVKRLLLGPMGTGVGAAASAEPELVPDLLWTLSCISESSDQLRSTLMKEGFLEYCLSLLGSLDSISLVRLTPALRTVGNFLTGTEQETQQVLDAGLIPLLTRLLRYPLELVRKEACWATSNVAAGTKEQKQRLFAEPGLLEEIIDLSAKAGTSVRKEAMWVLCNLCEGGSAEQIEHLLDRGALRVLTAGLLHPSEQIYPVAAAGLQCILRRDDRVHPDTAACTTLDRTLQREQLQRLVHCSGEDDGAAEVGDDVLAPMMYAVSVEERWQELCEGLESGEMDRVQMMRNLRSMIRARSKEMNQPVYERGEERRKEEEEEEEEELRASHPHSASSACILSST